PLLAGLSVAVGYLLGGVLPLFPYFFVNQVKDGLFWSFGVCAVALFVFGFCKDFAHGLLCKLKGVIKGTPHDNAKRRLMWAVSR
ncbi:hypothetical protein C8A03DRAFT_17357, partial [Achaetomium macrosporum]